MTNSRLLPAVLAAGVLLLGGCDGVRERVGLVLSAPDEFNVVSHAPLRVPSSLEELPSPRPGAPRPQELRPEQLAQEALFGKPLPDNGPGPGETLLIAAAGAADLDPGIRSVIDEERLEMLETTWVEDINPLRGSLDPTEVRIDVEEERKRLQNNAELGLPPNAGDFGDAIVVEKDKAPLEGLF